MPLSFQVPSTIVCQVLKQRVHPFMHSIPLLQTASACLPEGITSSGHVSAALLLVREEVQLLDLASELEALRTQLNQVGCQAHGLGGNGRAGYRHAAALIGTLWVLMFP